MLAGLSMADRAFPGNRPGLADAINETLLCAVKRSARVNGWPPKSEHTMPRKTKPEPFDHLTTPELIEGYLDEAIATGDPDVIRLALNVVARARV